MSLYEAIKGYVDAKIHMEQVEEGELYPSELEAVEEAQENLKKVCDSIQEGGRDAQAT